MTKHTPMMQQWFACKKKAEDSLLLFRLGDFYEAFYDDAALLSKELNLTLTQRQNIPMCGVPHHTCDNYIDKLIAKGYKVAIAEQQEDAKQAKGLVRRDVSRIVSPATIINSSLINEKSNNFFVALDQVGSVFGLTAIDLCTSEFKTLEVKDIKELKDELFKLKPSEILLSTKFHNNYKTFFEDISFHFKFLLNIQENWFFDIDTSYNSLTSHFKVNNLDGFGLKNKTAAINTAGALLNHLKDNLCLNLNHIKKITTSYLNSFMAIDHSCIRNLELFESFSNGKITTLLNVLDFTNTPMGSRLLKNWIKHPLLDIDKIQDRQEAILGFLKCSFFNDISSLLSNIKDLERIIMKISSNYASPRDLVALRYSLENALKIKGYLNFFTSSFIKKALLKLYDLSKIISLIKNSITDTPPAKISDCNVIKEGYDKHLDELRNISKNSKQWIANYQNKLKETLQIKTLKVGFTKIFGYYIEVSKTLANKMPSNFQRKQTLVNTERFISEELKIFEHKVLTAEEKIKALENLIFSDIKQKICEYSNEIFATAEAIAKIDCICSLSIAAKEYNYKKPIIDNSDILHIVEGRHPVIDANIHDFIPNDTILDKENRLILITGPNMAGKSTYIRQVALIVIMAQIGSFIPAKSAQIGIVDKLFSRIGAYDDLTRGLSTFMIEMTEAANILNNASSNSLIILDEIGRGTSTYDGISIAWSIAKYLLTTKGKKAKTLFATHYWELTQMEKEIPQIVNCNIAVKETNGEITFLRKIEKGSTDKSYGIHVAKIAGLPQEVILNAEEMLLKLETSQDKTPPKTTVIYKNSKVVDEIKQLDTNNISPLEALNKLFELKQKALKS